MTKIPWRTVHSQLKFILSRACEGCLAVLRADAILRWVRGPRVLDVGCAGHTVEPDSKHWVHGRLRSHFPGVVGIDFSAYNVEFLRSLGFSNVSVQDAETFSVPGLFDTIVAGELIEHLSNPGKFLERARDHLAPGGRIVLTTPYPFSLLCITYAFFKYPRTCQNPEHTCWFCPHTIGELARRARLKIVHFELIEDYRNDDPSMKYRVLVRLLRFLGSLVPERLRSNCMLLVLEPREYPAT